MADAITTMITEMGKDALDASRQLSAASPAAVTGALLTLADLLESERVSIQEANQADVAAAQEKGMEKAKVDRLRLTDGVIREMAAACREVAAMPDVVGAMDSQWMRPNGMLVGRMRIPLGVVAMIFESRPNVTVDASILCLKTGNAVILRGGSEALQSNIRLMECIQKALTAHGLPARAAQLVPIADRVTVAALCRLDQYIDVMIPRGGEGLIRAVSEQATMPVLKHDKGVCHAYLDLGADTAAAIPAIVNSKVQRPSTCNALECLLVNREEAATTLPVLGEALVGAGVEIRACPEAFAILHGAGIKVSPARDEDFGQEFGDCILALKVVGDLDEALAHIARYGSRHTEVIFTRDLGRASRFVREADASMAGVNVSTRLNDGGQLGLGAEIGISTSKLHAFGPMGLKELTTTKFVVMGNGQVRE